MKTIIRSAAFWLVVVVGAFCNLPATAFAQSGTNLLTEIAGWRSTNDVADILHSLPAIEQLWPHEPEMYFRCMAEATTGLSHASATNKEVAESMLVVCTNLMKTNYPADPGITATCIAIQCAAIESCFNAEILRRSKACLLAYGRFLGEIRSLRIPNYTMRGAGVPPGTREIFVREHVPPSYDRLTNAADRQEYDRLAAENEKGRQMDNLQHILLMADNGTKFMLMAYSSYFPASNPTNADFIREIGVEARLTEVERQELGKK
jgi:hypothetical protein